MIVFFKGDIELGPLGPRAVVKVERGEADIALEEQQENLQNLESIVIEVEDERVLDANVKMEVVGTEEVVEDQEDQGAYQGAVGGVVDDQQDQGDQGREVRGAKLKKEKKKKVRGDEGAREDEVDPFEVFSFFKKIELEK